jgi:hypothetical protein
VKNAFILGFSDALTLKNIKFFFLSFVILLLTVLPIYLLLSEVVETLFEANGLAEGWMSWVTHFITQVLIGTFGYFLFVPMIFLVISLFSEKIVENIRKKRYPEIEVAESTSALASLLASLFIVLRYVLYFLLASPLLLLFGIGHLLYAVIGFMLFRKLLLLDVLGTHLSYQEVSKQSSTFSGGKHVIATLILYLLSLIPLLNLFVPYFSICVIANQSFLCVNKKKR